MPPASGAQAFLARITKLPPSGPEVFDALSQALQPSLDDEAELRKLFATDRNNPRLQDPHVGLVDVFDAPADIRITRARIVKDEQDLNFKFVLPLTSECRRQDGAPAMVSSLDEFKKNWVIFTEGSLSQLLDWNNVIAAGGSVQACLTPVPDSARMSKRALRKHFHNNAYPTSDIDLFLYGLTPEQAEAKINAIYEAVRDSVPWDVTCIRTKHTVSIHSQYPYRVVQIVLRLYSSPAEILAGFDVDAPCCAYDGERVWANARAVVAMMRQCNTVDMTRRSPSYEVRLVKYSARDFEVYVPSLRREDIDPTIFERSITRIQGLARLLVLERLTTADARDRYLTCRRNLRGRPQGQNVYRRRNKRYKGDLKGEIDFTGLEMNDYDVVSLHIPYGPGWDARRIEKLVYHTVRSPFNPKNKDRRLHRHPAFFGTMQECLEDCCEYCPEPKDEEERKLREEEDKAYLRGRITFIEEDPGRQSISGSFNPIDVGEWAEQAYMGPTEKLFAAIVACDREAVTRLIKQEDIDVNRRDHVGRTPLHMAIMVKAIDIACDLVDADARMTARVADGRTALHLAAQLDLPEVVRKLLDRSALNEEKAKEAEEEARRMTGTSADKDKLDANGEKGNNEVHDSNEGPRRSEEGDNSNEGKGGPQKMEEQDVDDSVIPEEEDEFDIFDVNAPDWDLAFTPLQYAIVSGSTDTVDQLIAAGADVGLVTTANRYSACSFHQLTVTALAEDGDAVHEIARRLFAARAMSSQASDDLFTIFHRVICAGKPDLVHTFLRHDPNAKAVVNIPCASRWNLAVYPIVSAIAQRSYSIVAMLLAYGAKLVVNEEDFRRAVSGSGLEADGPWSASNALGQDVSYLKVVCQPLEAAVAARDDIATLLTALGSDVNSLPLMASRYSGYHWGPDPRVTILEWTRFTARALEKRLQETDVDVRSDAVICQARALAAEHTWKGEAGKDLLKACEDEKRIVELRAAKVAAETEEKKRKLQEAKNYFTTVKSQLEISGAKTWKELLPKHQRDEVEDYYSDNNGLIQSSIQPSSYHVLTKTWLTFPEPAHMVPRYDELFEACWDGDNAKIQKLCLPKSEDGHSSIPLHVTVQFEADGVHGSICNPLSIAIACRNWDTARLILAIASAQYEPEKSRGSNEDHEDEDEDNEDDISINFANIAKQPSAIKSPVSPQEFLNRETNIRWLDSSSTVRTGSVLYRAIAEDDLEAFVKIADLYSSLPEPQPLPEGTLSLVVRHDRPAMLDELIRRYGVGIDTESENEQATVSTDSNRKYSKIYLGLNVHGKKQDVATKKDRHTRRYVQPTRPLPLLWDAATSCALKVIEYLKGEQPLAAYQYYASTHSDSRACYIRRLPDLASVLPDWIGWTTNSLNESAMTAAVMSSELVVIKTLLSMNPDEMERALSARIKLAGYNHLLVATAWSVSPDVFDYLLSKGLSPTETGRRGWNILHILCAQDDFFHAELLHHILRSLPHDVIGLLLSQQSKSNRNTPLHIAVKRKRVDLVRMLLDTKASSFLLRDSEGSTPLHVAIKHHAATITGLLANAGPVEALYVEDGVGYTPLETALPEVAELTTNLNDFTERPFDLEQQSIEIPRLRATVEALLEEGRLRAGTKLATELVKFTERMEARLKEEKRVAEAENLKNPPEAKEEEFKTELDDHERPRETLKALQKALAARPFAQTRMLIHLSEVHTSVQKSLDRSKKTTEQPQAHEEHDDILNHKKQETLEDKAKRFSALHHCSTACYDHFGDDDI
ncbi:ankyrin [Wolfiporia cocos MD-104 SS10]|uniref:Ankyrin n=1 Tax=Wolfiporia cocos (strain MD-104) TaxID=742152 RepID=A0A2H3JCE0_WOLCO|nr:ankyrin [Wolfiporia cocos MD-104 SS10]